MPIGLKGNSDGSGAIQIGGSDAISISTGLNTTFAGTITATGTVAGTTGTLYPIVSGTAVSATGTSIDFTGIPSWVKRITVMFSGVSASGTSAFLIRLGTSSGVVSSGYNSTGSGLASASTASASSTVGLVTRNARTAGAADFGVCQIVNLTGNTWVINGGFASSATTENSTFSGGISNLGGVLDRVRVTTANGTDTFTAGTINLLWE